MQQERKNRDKCLTKPNKTGRLLSVWLLLWCSLLAGSIHAQNPQATMNNETAKLEAMIKQKLTMVKHYTHHPAYYVQVNTSGCRLLVSVNDIPLGYNFVIDDGESMLYPINNYLFASGEYSVSISVYPLLKSTHITTGASVNVKIMYYPEPDSKPVELGELNLPDGIGKQHLPHYQASTVFRAHLPFDHSDVLRKAVDLRKVPNLEEQVVAHYNRVRQMMIHKQYYEYNHMRLPSTWILTDMNYLTEASLREAYLSPDDTFEFGCNFVDWTVVPIANYEMIVCGHGKLVYLRRKTTMDEVLHVEYYETEEDKKENQGNPYISTMFIVLYMPRGSHELQEIY